MILLRILTFVLYPVAVPALWLWWRSRRRPATLLEVAHDLAEFIFKGWD